MRRRLLRGLDELFRKYLPFVAAVWMALVLVDVLLALLVFHSARVNIWYVLAATTMGCIIALALIWALKALFHKKVMRLLADEQPPTA